MDGIGTQSEGGNGRYNQLDSYVEENKEDKEFHQVKNESFEKVKNFQSKMKSKYVSNIKVETTNTLPCFGSGTLARPRVKFYFNSPCPQLGISS